MLPFRCIPRIMIIELAKSSVYWLNAFPHHNGISPNLSPRAIIIGDAVDYHSHCRFEYGQYVQTHEEHDNTMLTRTTGAIALRPTGNHQGGFYFMSLTTGRILNQQHATTLPMPAEVIQRMHQLADAQEAVPELIFGNRDNRLLAHEIEDDPADPYIPDENTHDETLIFDLDTNVNSIHTEQASIPWTSPDGPAIIDTGNGIPDLSTITGGNTTTTPMSLHEECVSQYDGNENIQLESVQETNTDNDDGAAPSTPTMDQPEMALDTSETPMVPETPVVESTDTAIEDQPVVPDVPELNDQDDMVMMPDTTNEMENRYGARSTHWQHLRPRKQQSYEHRFGADNDIYMTKSELLDPTVATPQMSMKQGLKLFGADRIQKIKKELLQLHQLQVIEPKDLTPAQQREALGYLMFLKRKRNGRIKGRGCADGRPQRNYIPQEDAMAPTVSTEAVFLTALIDALEG